MKSRCFPLFQILSSVLLTLNFLIFPGCGGGSSGTGGFGISGRIIANNGTPIVNVAVTLLNSAGTPVAVTTSNSQGSYQFDDVEFDVGAVFLDLPDSDFDAQIPFDFVDGTEQLDLVSTQQADGTFDSEFSYLDEETGEVFDEDFVDEDQDGIDDEADDGVVDDTVDDETPADDGADDSGDSSGDGDSGDEGSGGGDSGGE
jgi:hypothetical protein